jgi:hypothetical protein
MDSTRRPAHEAAQPVLPFLHATSSRFPRQNFPRKTGRRCELLFDAGKMIGAAPPETEGAAQVETAKDSA